MDISPVMSESSGLSVLPVLESPSSSNFLSYKWFVCFFCFHPEIKRLTSLSRQSYHTFLDIQHVPTGGIVVPQKVYTSGHIFQVAPPIQFTEYGHRGISLRNAFVENFAGMVDGTTLPALAPAGTQRIATRIEVRFIAHLPYITLLTRFQWPGYGPWSLNMNIVDRTRAANPINKAKLAHNIARAVHTFMQVVY